MRRRGFQEESTKIPPACAACACGTGVGGFRSPATVLIEVIVRPRAFGRLHRKACMLTAAACAAAMLSAASAGTAPADGIVHAASAGAVQTPAAAQTMASRPGRGLGEPAAARDTAIRAAAASSGPPAPPRTAYADTGRQPSPAHSRSALGPVNIVAGVLIICFAALAVLAARRRGGLAPPSRPPAAPRRISGTVATPISAPSGWAEGRPPSYNPPMPSR